MELPAMDDDGRRLVLGLSLAGFEQQGDDGAPLGRHTRRRPRRVPQVRHFADQVVLHAFQLQVRRDVVVAQLARFQRHLRGETKRLETTGKRYPRPS